MEEWQKLGKSGSHIREHGKINTEEELLRLQICCGLHNILTDTVSEIPLPLNSYPSL